MQLTKLVIMFKKLTIIFFEPVLNYILEVIHSVETAVRHIYEISSLIYKVTMKIKIKAMGINVDEIDKTLKF